MMPAAPPQARDEPLTPETIIMANLVVPQDVQAYVLLMCFMFMTHEQRISGNEELVEDVAGWSHFPLEILDDAGLPATLTMNVFSALCASPLLGQLLARSHVLFSYPGKPESDDDLAEATIAHYRAIIRVAIRLERLFKPSSTL